jgi:hypothetical protein
MQGSLPSAICNRDVTFIGFLICRNPINEYFGFQNFRPLPHRSGFFVAFSPPFVGNLGFLRAQVHNSHPGVVNRLLHTVPMNRLAAILPSAQVLAGVDATSKKRAF